MDVEPEVTQSSSYITRGHDATETVLYNQYLILSFEDSKPEDDEPACAEMLHRLMTLGSTEMTLTPVSGELLVGSSGEGSYIRPRRGWSTITYQVHSAYARSHLGNSAKVMALDSCARNKVDPGSTSSFWRPTRKAAALCQLAGPSSAIPFWTCYGCFIGYSLQSSNRNYIRISR